MTNPFLNLTHPSIREINPYKPGKPISELQRETGITDIIKLASNENPLGFSPAVLPAVEQSLRTCALYPDGSGHDLKQALGDFYNLSPEQITLGAGTEQLLYLITTAFIGPNDEAIMSEFGFIVFRLAMKIAQGRLISVPEKNYQHDLKAMLKKITDKTKLIYIANPNNPTGTCVQKTELADFLKQVSKNVIVILDEAYYEFFTKEDDPNALSLLAHYPNLVITRTFSKVYGLAGFRVGYALSHPELADVLNRVRLPFNVSTPAMTAALAALTDQEHVQKTLEINKLGMRELTKACQDLNLKMIPSVTNFLTIETGPNSDQNFKNLMQCGIIVRPLKDYGLPNHLRVSIGTPEQNTRFIEALSKQEVYDGI